MVGRARNLTGQGNKSGPRAAPQRSNAEWARSVSMMLAAVDAGDVSAHHLFFSAQLRDTIATFLFMIVAYAAAVTYQWLDSRGRIATGAPGNETSLPFHLCALVLGLAGLWVFLFASAAAHSTPFLHVHWIFFWIERDFIRYSWTAISWSSTVSFFVIFPFAFLYEEAEGFTQQRGFLSRVLETVCVQVLFAILFHGSLSLLQYLLTGQALDLGFFTNGYAFHLPGLFVYLAFYRNGFQRFVRAAFSMFVSWPTRFDRELLASYEFELEDLLVQIESLRSSHQHADVIDHASDRFAFRSRDDEKSGELLEQRLHELQSLQTEALQRSSFVQAVFRNVSAGLVVVIAIWMPCVISIRAATKCQALFSSAFYRLFGYEYVVTESVLQRIWDAFRPAPPVALAIDLCLAAYLFIVIAAAALDSWSFKWAAGLVGHSRSVTQEMLARNTFLLLMCSTLPEATSLLGLTQIDIEAVLPEMEQFSSLLYCVAFLVIQIFAALELIGIPISSAVVFLCQMMAYCCCCCVRCRRRPAARAKKRS